MKRKIDLMHNLYSKDPAHTCGDCCNYWSARAGEYCNRPLRKCERYGLTHSEASDWAKSWTACGMFNVPVPGKYRPVIETVRGEKKKDSTPFDGQLSL